MGPKKKKPLGESVWDDDRESPFDDLEGELARSGEAGESQ